MEGRRGGRENERGTDGGSREGESVRGGRGRERDGVRREKEGRERQRTSYRCY